MIIGEGVYFVFMGNHMIYEECFIYTIIITVLVDWVKPNSNA